MDERTRTTELSDAERLDWLQLIRSDNVGPRTFSALLRHYGSARGALAALPELARRGGASRAPRAFSRDDAEKEIAALGKLGVNSSHRWKTGIRRGSRKSTTRHRCSPSRAIRQR